MYAVLISIVFKICLFLHSNIVCKKNQSSSQKVDLKILMYLFSCSTGNRDIAPAPPDVVAQIVAEAEKKMKLSGPASTDHSVKENTALETGSPKVSS